jgi:hypothetical protein
LRNLLKAAVALVGLLTVVLVSVILTNTQSTAPKSGTYPVTETAAVGSLGFADSWLWFLSPEDVNHQLDLMVATGVHSARIMLPWAGVQPGPDAWDWGQADLMVSAANARGISVVAVLNSTPGWATAGQPIASPPDSADTYGNFAGTVASHFAGRIAAYELWNEENAVTFWASGPEGPQADRYTSLLKAAYPRIKAADPGATVLVGGFSPTVNFFAITRSPVDFLSEMYAAGAKGSFDAVAFHPYLFTNDPSTKFATSGARTLFDGLRGVMGSNGDGGKQIWATEFGEATSNVDEALQASRIRDFIVTWRALPGAGPAFIYTTRDRATGSSNQEDTFGVYRTDWSPKPAADVVRSLA